MLEELEGRIKWEHTPRGIQVAIPARRSPMAALYTPLVLIWLVFASLRYWHVLAAPHQDDSEFTMQMVAIGIYAIGFCFFVFWLAWTFTNDTILSLDPSELRIQRRVIGVELSTRRFPTHKISQLEYIPPKQMATYEGVVNPASSRIQFRAESRSHSFARGISENEAIKVIEEMMEVYNFPKAATPETAGVVK